MPKVLGSGEIQFDKDFFPFFLLKLYKRLLVIETKKKKLSNTANYLFIGEGNKTHHGPSPPPLPNQKYTKGMFTKALLSLWRCRFT
jgi:hypothetical protein